MEKKNKKTRLEFLFEIHKKDCEKYNKQDPHFLNFLRINYSPREGIIDFGVYNHSEYIQKLFNFFVDSDPTDNKEYVNWFLNLYRNILKVDNKTEINGEVSLVSLDHDLNRRIFFEDLQTKVKSALDTFSFLKKTKVLSNNNKDINSYKTIEEFMKVIRPFINTDSGDDSVHSLDHKELSCIRNYIENNDNAGKAELIFEDDTWIVVITHDKEANKQFGKYTEWCTSGTKYGDMFESYDGRGKLFVLIKKGYGSKRAIDSDPTVRLQFHFEDDMYMDALDKSINVSDFLNENLNTRNIFRGYIVNSVIPKIQKNSGIKGVISYLKKLRMGDDLIEVFIETKPKIVDLSSYPITEEELSKLSKIESIEELNLSNCFIKEIPKSFSRFKNLKKLVLRNNKELNTLPTNELGLTKLNILDCAGCNITKLDSIEEYNKLEEIVLDFNPNLKSLPKLGNKLSKLIRLTASNCNLTKIDDDVLECKKLFLIDVHNNPNLTYINPLISKLPEMVAICLESTKIPYEVVQIMKSENNGTVSVIKY